jgi:hypothetical protein
MSVTSSATLALIDKR